MKADPFGVRAHQPMGSADTGHPASGGLQVIAVDTNVAKLRIDFVAHQGALKVFLQRALMARIGFAKASLTPQHDDADPVDSNRRLSG
jgi:hypothetical protein